MMQHQIRLNVFETNSSSSHSLTLTQGDLAPSPFDADSLRRGIVEVGMSEYGWEWKRYYTTRNKLSYLLTQVMSRQDSVPEGANEEVTRALCEKHPELAMLVRVVKDHTGCDLQFIAGSSGYIDHDSEGEGMELFRSEEKLKQFLFSTSSYIQTGNDNDAPPFMIETDKDSFRDLMYAQHIREPQPGWVPVCWYSATDYGPLKLMLKNDVILSSTSHEALFQAVVQQGTVVRVEIEEKAPYSWFNGRDFKPRRLQDLSRMGLMFSANMNAVLNFKKTRRDDSPRVTRFHYTSLVPPELASQIKALTA